MNYLTLGSRLAQAYTESCEAHHGARESSHGEGMLNSTDRAELIAMVALGNAGWT